MSTDPSQLDRAPSLRSPTRYTVLGELARGGLGRVFTASDDVLGRTVAIKQPIAPTPEARARFEREARLTARLQHAGVVPVYDAGIWEDGQPYFVMKMVEGPSLAELIKAARDSDERLGLLARVLVVADTVAYAHSRGVIHRDLKPANVIVGDHGETLVIDWGLGLVIGDPDDPDAEDSLSGAFDIAEPPSEAGRVIGTPQFMPPEQAEGAAVDERADVYAMGAILYNVVAGEAPFGGGTASRVVTRVRAEGPTPLRQRAPDAPRDLVAIVERAMAREPADRYANAGELAEDLRRFLDGQRVWALDDSLSTVVARWIRQHRTAIAAVVVTLAWLVVLGVMAVRGILAERNAAVEARRAMETRQNALTLLHARRSLADDPTAAVAWLKQHRPEPGQAWLAEAVAEEAAAHGVARHVFRFPGPSPARAVSPLEPLLAVGGNDGSLRLHHLDSGGSQLLGGHPVAIRDLAFSPRAPRLATLDVQGRLRLWGTDGGLRGELALGGGRAGMIELRWAPNGSRLAAVIGDSTLVVVQAEPLGAPARYAMSSRVSAFDFCPGTDRLVALDFEGRAMVLDPGATRPRLLPGKHPDAQLLCLPDGRRFVSGGVDGAVQLWDTATGWVRLLGRHRDWVTTLAVSPDGRRLATGSGDDTVLLFDLALPAGPIRTLSRHGDTVRGLVFTPDGRTLASLDYHSTVRLWNLDSGEAARTFRTGSRRATRLELTSDGRGVVASSNEEAHLWPVAVHRSLILRGASDAIIDLDWSPDGRRIAAGGRDSTVRVWDAALGTLVGSAAVDSWIIQLRFLGADALMATTRLARLWLLDPARGGARSLALGTGAAAMSPAAVLSPRQDRIAHPQSGTVVVRELRTGATVALDARLSAVVDIAFSRDGRRVAALSADGVVGLWDATSGRPVVVRQLGERIDEISLSDDGRWAAVRTDLEGLRLWDLASDRVSSIESDSAVVDLLFFTDDSGALVYKAADASIRVLEVASGTTTRILRGHRAPIHEVRRSPAGPVLASSDTAGFVRLWNLRTGARASLRAHDGPIDRIAFSPDGKRLATAISDTTVRLWEVDAILAGAGEARPEALTSAVIDESQRPRTIGPR